MNRRVRFSERRENRRSDVADIAVVIGLFLDYATDRVENKRCGDVHAPDEAFAPSHARGVVELEVLRRRAHDASRRRNSNCGSASHRIKRVGECAAVLIGVAGGVGG